MADFELRLRPCAFGHGQNGGRLLPAIPGVLVYVPSQQKSSKNTLKRAFGKESETEAFFSCSDSAGADRRFKGLQGIILMV